MDELIEKSRHKLRLTRFRMERSLMQDINWEARLIGIKGSRGVGKTTLLLQYLKNEAGDTDTLLYVSLDHIWFSRHTLVGLADDFVKRGGTRLFLDEVHKYPNWAQELKNIYDDYPELQVVFTGSSLLELLNAQADLSRRAVVYTMQGLSFREYLQLETGISFGVFTLEDILKEHTRIAEELVQQIKPLKYFSSYLKNGYYPYYLEQLELYETRLGAVINMMLEIELPLLRKVEPVKVHKIKQLLLVLAESVPFIPNVSKISEKTGISRGTLLLYLHYLEEIALTRNLFKTGGGISKLQKPSKIYLENTNLAYALARDNANKGNLRETFFANQVSYRHSLLFSDHGDFLVDGRHTFEIGGKEKGYKQVGTQRNAFVASDDIETGTGNKIPLWLFGFLY